MKVTIKRTCEIDGYWFKLIDENGKIKHFAFDPSLPDDKQFSEKSVYNRALELAHTLEDNSIPKEVTVYETPTEEKETVGIDLSKIDEV